MNFTVYSKEGCPHCEKIKQILDLTKLTYVVYNLDEHFDREGFISEFGENSTYLTIYLEENIRYEGKRRASKKIENTKNVLRLVFSTSIFPFINQNLQRI